jgi:tRNA isopentenyl-2-thiomethyl-A-37 hydroxylase MiaE
MVPGDLEIWLNHFEHHARHRRRVPRGLSDVLKSDERQLIASSIATFQLGESSAGRTLLRAAERFARQKQVPHLVRIVELLIREEQRHASLLRAFMQDHRIPLKKADWTDRVFRRVRRFAGLQQYLSVLTCAELIGKVYYRALESATDCKRLRVLCRAIVSDELAHIGFETQLLFALRAGRAAPLRALTNPAHRIFFTITAGVVWFTHRAVLRRAGYSARSFLHSCLAQYAFYLEPTFLSRGLQVSSSR